MRIPEHDPFRLRETSLPEAKGKPKASESEPSPRHGTEGPDRIELSGHARETGILPQTSSISFDARAERLASIAEMVANGAYAVPNERILDGLIWFALSEKGR